MKILICQVIFLTLCLKSMQGKGQGKGKGKGKVTCQNLPKALAKETAISIVCFDDEKDGCENGNNGCILPKKCKDYKDRKTYTSGDKSYPIIKKAFQTVKNYKEIKALKENQQDSCDLSDPTQIKDTKRIIRARNVLL